MTETNARTRSSTDWMLQPGWGVFFHFLAGEAGGPLQEENGANVSVDAWNARVDGVDVDGLARQLAEIGAGYLGITIGQNSGHYCSPNAAYDELVGISPSKCSRRDLIADLAAALSARNIRLIAYIPSGAPSDDPVARERLEWKWGFSGDWGGERTGLRLASFQRRWESVLREWSLRWGDAVAGWWVDGCYFSDEMYRHDDEPNFRSLTAALRAGNPDAVVALNPGITIPVISLTEHEDYTAGEVAEAFPVCPGRWVDGAQYHVLSYLGQFWGKGQPRFHPDFVRGYTRDVNSRGGVVTWDVPPGRNGLISEAFMRQLELLR